MTSESSIIPFIFIVFTLINAFNEFLCLENKEKSAS
jgi:hypothetical protein